MMMRRTNPTEPIEPASLFNPQSKGAPSHGLTLNLKLPPFLLKGAIP